MKTFIDCIPCYMLQAVQTGRLCGLSDDRIKKLLDTIGKQIEHFSLDDPPPLMVARLQQTVTGMIGIEDPMKELKRKSNEAALGYYDRVMKMIVGSKDPLRMAIQATIAGNIIDYGAIRDLDVDAELTRLMQEEQFRLEREDGELFAYERFVDELSKAETLLYVGDNAGEIVFDKALLATIKRLFPRLEVTFATRGKPILNDALIEDARSIGLHEMVHVVSSGVGTPGLVLELANPEFRDAFYDFDLIISKGQGNIEALFDIDAPIYFLLVAKCQPIADMLGCKVRDIILKRQAQIIGI